MMRPMPLSALLLLAFLLAIPRPCLAAGQPVLLRSELRQPEKIWVGQRLDLDVTLFTTSAFAGVPRFDLPKDAGLAILEDDSHPLLDTKTIDGVSYISKQYTLSLFPLRTGTLTIPAFPVEFGYQGDVGQTVDTTLSTAAARVTVLDVPGADPQLPLVTATDLNIDDRWDPSPDKVVVGDAFTRTITMRATGLPGMALPPLRLSSSDGVAVYARQPQVGTDTARGDFIGKRVETFSLVCQKVGTYTLPEMRIQWWNPTGEQLQMVRLQSRTFKVTPNPLLGSTAPAGAADTLGTHVPWPWAIMAVIVGTVLCVLFVRRRSRRYLLDQNKTEKELFKQFKRATASNDQTEIMQSFIRWLDTATGSSNACSVHDFVQNYGSQELERQLTALEASLYGKTKQRWSESVLYRQVSAARHKYCRRRFASSRNSDMLGSLNP